MIGKPGSRDGNSIKSNSLLIIIFGHNSKNRNVMNLWLLVPGDAVQKN